MNIAYRINAGFTIVELITVIVLLGVLSAVAVARGGRSSDFEPRRFTSTAAEQYRFAHGLSSGRYGDTIRFSIEESAGAWRFTTASTVDGGVRQEELSAPGIALSLTNGANSLSFSSGENLQLEFSPTGDLSAVQLGATVLQPNLGIELNIVGSSSHSLCIYPTGYLGAGNCE